MGIALVVLITILEILGVACALATSAAPKRALGELMLLAAALVVLRECLTLRETEAELRRSNDPFPGFPAHSRPAAARPAPPQARKIAAGARITPDHTVEQIAHEMLMQSFRQLALKYHPDRGGDPEIMRRVYAARRLLQRAIRR